MPLVNSFVRYLHILIKIRRGPAGMIATYMQRIAARFFFREGLAARTGECLQEWKDAKDDATEIEMDRLRTGRVGIRDGDAEENSVIIDIGRIRMIVLIHKFIG